MILARRVVVVVVVLLLLLLLEDDDVNDDDDREVLLLLLKVIVKVVDSVFDSLSLYVVSRVVVFTVRSFFMDALLFLLLSLLEIFFSVFWCVSII